MLHPLFHMQMRIASVIIRIIFLAVNRIHIIIQSVRHININAANLINDIFKTVKINAHIIIHRNVKNARNSFGNCHAAGAGSLGLGKSVNVIYFRPVGGIFHGNGKIARDGKQRNLFIFDVQ